MTFASALALFDEMKKFHPERCERIVRTFDLIRKEIGVMSVRDAFIAAVDDEAHAIETEMLLQQGTMQ